MKYITHLIIASLLLLATSCATKEHFTVLGTPGENIYTPDRQYLATVQDNGITTVSLPSNAYYAYLLSHTEGDSLWRPFALDIRTNRHRGARAVYTTGLVIAYTGLALAGVGEGMNENGASGSDAVFWSGIGGAALGVGIGISPALKLNQYSYLYNFSYAKSQETNSDIELTEE